MKDMSAFGVSTLRFIRTHDVTIDYLRRADMRTLKALLDRGLIERRGPKVVTTREGEEYLSTYTQNHMKLRMHEADISDSVARLLRYARVVRGRRAG